MDLQENALEPKPYTVGVVSGRGQDAVHPGLSLSLKTKVLYGLGEVSTSIKTFTFGLFLLFFYTSVLGLPGTLVGVATSLGLVWDATIDPLIGYLSDRARFRLGRRHSFMLVGALGVGISFVAIFSPPSGLSTGALFVWLMVTSLLLRTTNSIFAVPYHALGAELSQDYHERTSITGIRAVFALGGTLVAAGLSFAVFFPNTTPGVDPKFNAAGYLSMGLSFGLAMTLTGLITILATLSQRPQLAAAPRTVSEGRVGFYQGIGLALRHPAFVILTLSVGVFFMASVINATLSVYYMTYYVRITASNALSAFQLVFYVGALAGVGFWMRLAKTFDKHRLYFSAALATGLIVAAAYWLAGEGHLFGTGHLLPLAIGNGMAGFFASGMWAIPASMVADVTDQDELITGRRREGAFFGIFSFSQQIAASLAILVTGIGVDRFAGLTRGQVEQSAQTTQRLAMLFSLLPAALIGAAAFLILGYGLTQRRVKAIQVELAKRLTDKTHEPQESNSQN